MWFSNIKVYDFLYYVEILIIFRFEKTYLYYKYYKCLLRNCGSQRPHIENLVNITSGAPFINMD